MAVKNAPEVPFLSTGSWRCGRHVVVFDGRVACEAHNMMLGCFFVTNTSGW